MSLSVNDIKSAKTDEQLLKLLSTELVSRLPTRLHKNYDALIRASRALPSGLRAMAATHRLDVSISLDDVGWHFYNFHHRACCDETEWGLRELGAVEAFEVFKRARELVEPHWEQIGSLKPSHEPFTRWYKTSGLEAVLKPLNEKLWAICSELGKYGLMTYWLTYARNNPEQVLKV